MKVRIDWDGRRLDAFEDNSSKTGWLGFVFAKNYPNLTELGWMVYYWPASAVNGTCVDVGPGGSVAAHDLAKLVNAGPPKPCDHECPAHPKCCV